MKKVLQINAVYGHGSTGTIVRDIEQLCIQTGIECYIASPDPEVRYANHGYKIGNVFDHKLHALLSRVNGRQAYFSHIPTWNLLKWINKINPDIVHLHNLHSNYININILLKYLAKNDIRTIITFHDCWYFTGGCFHYASTCCDRWMKECGKCPKKRLDTTAYFLDKSSRILKDRKKFLNDIPHLTLIGASEWVANECRSSILSNCTIDVIHNGFNLSVFKPTPSDKRKLYGLEGKFIILGPYSKWHNPINKNTFEFFRSHLNDDMVLVLFGSNSPRLEIRGHVIEVGFINNPIEMAALYSMADVFVNCTREDTLPGVNLECQATGTPVVTYNSTGCKETVDGVCGKAIEVGDYESLYNAVIEFKIIGKQNLEEKCISWIKNNFNDKDAYQKYINLYLKS